MPVSTIVCAPKYNGCGYIGAGSDFRGGDEDSSCCPKCNDDCAYELTQDNFISLTEKMTPDQIVEAGQRLRVSHGLQRATDEEIQAVVGQANCGCVYRAQQGIPCRHDLALLCAATVPLKRIA